MKNPSWKTTAVGQENKAVDQSDIEYDQIFTYFYLNYEIFHKPFCFSVC
jgi:hypothetical protein